MATESTTGSTSKAWLLSTKTRNQMEMLRGIANLRWPDEDVRSVRIPGELVHALVRKAQNLTKNFWPQLWEESDESALNILREFRSLLRGFWRAQDKRERSWYIQRCREYHQGFMLRQQMLPLRKELTADIERWLEQLVSPPVVFEEDGQNLRTCASVTAEIDAAFSRFYGDFYKRLNDPPPANKFEDALFKLQERAEVKSRAPKCCRWEECRNPYFFGSEKSRGLCSDNCAWEISKKKKREWKANHTKAKGRRGQ